MTKAERIAEKLHRGSLPEDGELRYLICEMTGSEAEIIRKLAREAADSVFGNKVYIRGLIEFTNFCRNDCFYCGIRRSQDIARYRLTDDDILGCCETGCSRADDCYRACAADVRQNGIMFKNPVAEVIFHGRNVDGSINLFTGAGFFAEMRTDQAGEQREGVVLQQFICSVGMTALLKQMHIAADIDTGGTGRCTGRYFFLMCIQTVYIK